MFLEAMRRGWFSNGHLIGVAKLLARLMCLVSGAVITRAVEISLID